MKFSSALLRVSLTTRRAEKKAKRNTAPMKHLNKQHLQLMKSVDHNNVAAVKEKL